MNWNALGDLAYLIQGWLPVLAPGLPLLASMLLLAFRHAPTLPFAVLPVLPALALAFSVGDNGFLFYQGVLLGLKLGMDAVSRVFLLFTSVLWAVSSVYANYYLSEDSSKHRFFFFHLLCMSGNIGVILAQDIPGFYMFFTLMSLAAYGLVIHDGTPAALRAGRVYIVMAVIGEALLAIAFLFVADAAGSTDLAGAGAAVAASGYSNLIIAFLIAGFGIKAGLVTLHMWLPLAHPVAPVPASALLSGAMIKAGLLGWMRFLPLGEASLPEWGWLCISAGLFGAFYGVAIGLFQDDKKTILAYSSISQMGIMIMGIGIGLLRAEAWPVVMTALLIYALHHAFAKGALFLATGLTDALDRPILRIAFFTGMVTLALALAGAPFTSGALAKTAMKQALVFLPDDSGIYIGFILQAAAAATTLLMARFIAITIGGAEVKKGKPARGLLFSWFGLLVFMLLLVSPLALRYLPVEARTLISQTFSLYGLKGALTPVLVGGLTYIAFIRLQKIGALRFLIPPGDVLELIIPLAGPVKRLFSTLSRYASGILGLVPSGLIIPQKFAKGTERLEKKLNEGANGFIFFFLVAAGLLVLIRSF